LYVVFRCKPIYNEVKMITGVETVAVLKGIAIGVKEIKENQKRMNEKLDQIQGGIGRIEKKLDEKILQSFHAANNSLIEAMRAEDQDNKKGRLNDAINKFNELTVLDENESTSGTSGKVDNKDLISLGYLGKFYCYVLAGEKINAAIHVYECVQKSVSWDKALTGLSMFPPEFFSKDYKQLFDSPYQQLLSINEKIQHKTKNDRVFITGVAIVSGGFLTVMAPLALGAAALAASPFAAGLAGAAATGVQVEMFKSLFLHPEELTRLQKEASELKATLNSLCKDLDKECKQKIQAIQQITSVNNRDNELLAGGWKHLMPSLICELERLIKEHKNQLSPNKQNGLRSQITKLQTGLGQGDINFLKQTIKEISEMVKALSGLAEGWKGLCNNLEKCGLLS
jgi:prefoldin subunit 5